jgi:DNA invertase Pin-like site-specific DNA recombinase
MPDLTINMAAGLAQIKRAAIRKRIRAGRVPGAHRVPPGQPGAGTWLIPEDAARALAPDRRGPKRRKATPAGAGVPAPRPA